MRIPFPASVVGWYWIISMSISGAPMRNDCAMPSPVQISALVVGLKHWPAPPEAWITALALKSSIAPSRMLRATAPQQLPVVVLHERGDEPLLVAVDLRVDLHQLLVEHVQQRLAGDVGDVVRARGGGAAEGARAELALAGCGGR